LSVFQCDVHLIVGKTFGSPKRGI